MRKSLHPCAGGSSAQYPWFMYLPGCAGFSGDPCGWYEKRRSTGREKSAGSNPAAFTARTGAWPGIPGVWEKMPGAGDGDI